MPFSVSLTASSKSSLHSEQDRYRHLLCIDDSSEKLSLDMAKEQLYGIQPRTVLSIEQHMDFQTPTCLQYSGVMVELSIVHEEHYRLVAAMLIRPHMKQHLVQDFFKESGIISSFDNLTAEQLVLSDCCNEWHRVLLLLHKVLSHRDPKCIVCMRTQLLLQSHLSSFNKTCPYHRICKVSPSLKSYQW